MPPRALIPALAILLLLPANVLAAGFAISEQSPVAGATGGAGVARSSDNAAGWYCPAALADGNGWRVTAGVLLAFPMITTEALEGGWDEQTAATPPSTPPHLYLSYAKGSWTAGVAFNVPFGSRVKWPDAWAGRFETVSSELATYRLAPFFGLRFGQVRVAAGIHVDITQLQVNKRLDFVDQEGQVRLDLSGVGVGGHLSIYLQLLDQLSLAATYKSRTVLSLNGTAAFDQVPMAFSAKAHDQTASAGYTLPDLIMVGAEYTPHPRVSIVLDLGVTVWSVYDALDVDFQDEATSDLHQDTSWETQVFIRGGAEARALPWLKLRGGIFYDPTPVPEETLAANSPDSDRLGFSAGLGFSLPLGFTIDLFYTHALMLGQPSTNDENLHARYGGNLHLAGLGLSWNSAGMELE